MRCNQEKAVEVHCALLQNQPAHAVTVAATAISLSLSLCYGTSRMTERQHISTSTDCRSRPRGRQNQQSMDCRSRTRGRQNQQSTDCRSRSQGQHRQQHAWHGGSHWWGHMQHRTLRLHRAGQFERARMKCRNVRAAAIWADRRQASVTAIVIVIISERCAAARRNNVFATAALQNE